MSQLLDDLRGFDTFDRRVVEDMRRPDPRARLPIEMDSQTRATELVIVLSSNQEQTPLASAPTMAGKVRR